MFHTTKSPPNNNEVNRCAHKPYAQRMVAVHKHAILAETFLMGATLQPLSKILALKLYLISF